MIEKHVVNLELSKRLKKLGVKQESHFSWAYVTREWGIWSMKDVVSWGYEEDFKDWLEERPRIDKVYSAFLSSELGELLPKTIKPANKKTIYYQSIHWSSPDKKWCFRYTNSRHNICLEMSFSESEADSRAKMLIYLIEKNLLTPNTRQGGVA